MTHQSAAETIEQRLPAGTVTFLFTDVEQSTKLPRELGAGARGFRAAPR